MIFNRANKPAHCLGGGKEYLGDSLFSVLYMRSDQKINATNLMLFLVCSLELLNA